MPLPRLRPAALAIALAACTLAAAARGAAETRTILPGYWEYKSDVLGSAKTETRCIARADIDKFFAGPNPGHYNCSYPVAHVAEGQARFVGVCVGKKRGERVPVSWAGTYAPTRFVLHGTITVALGALSLPVAAAVEAHRLAAECPAPGEAPG